MPYSPRAGTCRVPAKVVAGTKTSGFVDVVHDDVMAMK